MSRWYYQVSRDLSKLPDCIDYYEAEIIEAKKELTIRGGKSLETHSSELPGVTELRFGQLQEIEAILELLNIELRKTKTKVFRKFLEHYNKALSSRDADKFAEGDVEVVDIALLVNEFAMVRNKFLAVTKGLDQKSYMIGHITRLRCAGLDDAQLS